MDPIKSLQPVQSPELACGQRRNVNVTACRTILLQQCGSRLRSDSTGIPDTPHGAIASRQDVTTHSSRSRCACWSSRSCFSQVAVTVCRVFFVEGYMISTGSMAPTFARLPSPGYVSGLWCKIRPRGIGHPVIWRMSRFVSAQDLVAGDANAHDTQCPNCHEQFLNKYASPKRRGPASRPEKLLPLAGPASLGSDCILQSEESLPSLRETSRWPAGRGDWNCGWECPRRRRTPTKAS